MIADQLKGTPIDLSTVQHVLGPKPLLAKDDLLVALRVAQDVLEVEGEDWRSAWEEWDSGLQPLREKIVFFEPPKSVSELL